MTKKTLTIVSPVYNEEPVIHDFYTALRSQLDNLKDYSCDIIFVVDKCTDQTLDVVKEIAARDPSFSILALSSRFGYQMSLMAGIDHAMGDAVITMDADLQHPPSVIPLLLKEFEKGADIVHTVRMHTEGLGFVRRMQSKAFYWLINLISEVPILENASDFRLISQRVAKIVRTKLRERNLFLRGIINWMGFTQARVEFVAPKRTKGKTKFSLSRLMQFAFFGLISFSKKPLRAASITGLLFACFGFLFAGVTAVQYVSGNQFPSGWATVIVLLAIFGGFQLIFLGVIGEYIGAIFDEVKARPHYLVDEAINISL